MIDDAIRQFAEPPRQAGASVPPPAAQRTIPVAVRVGRERSDWQPDQQVRGVVLNADGPAQTETGNVWHHTPQLEMEIGVFNEQCYVLRGSGSIVVDPKIANVWNISLAATATLSFADPDPIPQDQIDAGRDRNRATGIVLRVIRNGHDYAFSGIEVASGTADRVRADANRDKWVADWWGGPDLGSNWELQLVASGYEAG